MAITPFSDNYLAKISYHSSQWLFLCYEKILKYITFYFQWLLLYIYLLKSYSESQFQRPHLDISPLSLRNFKDSIRKFFDLIRINFHLPHKVREIGSTFFFSTLRWLFSVLNLPPAGTNYKPKQLITLLRDFSWLDNLRSHDIP